MQLAIIVGVVLLVLGIIRKIKHLITLGAVVAAAAFVLNYLGILTINL
jgi:hypothetical protein